MHEQGPVRAKIEGGKRALKQDPAKRSERKSGRVAALCWTTALLLLRLVPFLRNQGSSVRAFVLRTVVRVRVCDNPKSVDFSFEIC